MPAEGMRVAVVGDVGAGGHRLFVDGVRHRDALSSAGGLAAAGRLPVVELLHGAQHVDERALFIVGHLRALNLRQRPFHHRPALRAAEHLLAHRFHDVLRHDAADHRLFGAARRIEDHVQRRLVAVPEERVARRVAEPLRNDHRRGKAPAADGISGLRFGRRRHLEILVGLHAGDDARGDRRCRPGR